MRKLDSVGFSLLLGLAPLPLLAAPTAAPITAIAKGDCAVAINASGQAVVTVTASCDKQTAATVQKLLEQQAEQRRKNAQVDKRQSGTEQNVVALQKQQSATGQDVAALQRQVQALTAAVKTITTQAQQGDASTAQKQAAANLQAGEPELAIAQLGAAADKAAADSTRQAQSAAALYRQQAALLATRDVKQALVVYQKALALEPGDYVTLAYAGDMAQAAGDSALALKLYRQMQQVATQALAQAPQSAAWQRELSVSHERIGGIQQAQGDGAGALQSFQARLAIMQKLAAQDPGNSQWQRDLTGSHIKIGDIQQAQGDGAGALQSFRASLAIAQKLAAQDPGNSQWQRDLSISHNKIGDMQKAQGDGAGALQSFRADLAIAQKLVTQDPGNALWQVDLAKSKLKVFTGETDTALRVKLLLEAIATLRELRAANRLDAADRTMLEKLEAFLQKPATP